MSTVGNHEIAVVTGASRGIGRAIANALAAEGVEVVLLGRRQKMLDEVVADIQRQGGRGRAMVCDFDQLPQVEAVVARCRRELGRLDLLVNNAGAFLEAPVEHIELADWERLLRVNLTAPFAICRGLLPMMYAQGRGKIINISSVAGLAGYYHQAAYCAVKHGLTGFSRALALEARPHGVHVHLLCPGGVRTEFFRGTHLEQRLAGQTMLEPEDVAKAAVFLYRQPANVDVPELVLRRSHVEEGGGKCR